MKKFLFFVCMMTISLTLLSQTAVNADGSIKYRGNVAIIVTSHNFTFKDGVFEKKVEDELITELKSALNAMAMQKFGNSNFGIVNRDNEAYTNVKKALEEQKLEDYIDGFSVQAKGEGADILFLTDITTYNENGICQIFISCRLINIVNNTGFHYSMKSTPISMSNTVEMNKQIISLVRQYEDFLYSHILDVYPEQYAISKSDGKKLYLSAYQPNGRILKDDKFYVFEYGQEILSIGNNNQPVQVLKKIATATDPESSGGYCVVKAEKAIKPSNNIVLFRNQNEPMVTPSPLLFTYFSLPYEPNTYDGFIRNRVNNAVYDALTRHPGAIIIEQEHLPDLKKERELQKTEDFIDGHVVEQMKALGSQYMLHLDNFKMNGNQVSFQLNMISIEQNRILRTVDVVTSIDNIENEMYKQICERISYPCTIEMKDKKNMAILTGWSLPLDSKIIIQATKEIQNPLTGEPSYTKVQICKGTVTEYMGCKSIVKIDDVLSDEDFKTLPVYSKSGVVNIMLDSSGIKTNTDTMSDVEKAVQKNEKSEKRKSMLNRLGNSLQQSIQIR
ncbi:MAG: hypothetical protein K2G41_04145 [Duncaniella sp.]|uniref:hypothetical protein n=1 Tax=Duncaniella sp. TaxID=2518496 RepID=UPI0023D5B911|nr:hypothetical protein [Duncaniella sp.]MDE6089873.1 hypothetical protein [Duncaniella sp.]